MRHADLLKTFDTYKEKSSPISILKNARYNLWLDIIDLIEKEWD